MIRACKLAIAAIAVATLAAPATAGWDPLTKRFSDGGDPPTLEALIEQLREAQQQGMTRDEMLGYLARVVDRRLSSTNRVSISGNDSYGIVYAHGPWADRLDRFEAERGQFDRQVDVIDDGKTYQHRAEWAWNNRMGNCNEAQSTTYFVLKELGIPARMIQSTAGHDFTVVGLADGDDPVNPYGWDDEARVVDGWLGESFTPEQAIRHKWIANHGKAKLDDLTALYDNPAQTIKHDQTRGQGVLKVYVMKKENPTERVAGAAVTVSGPASASGATDGNGFAQFTVAQGDYVVAVAPPTGSGLKAGGAGATVPEHRVIGVKVLLAKDEAPPELLDGLKEIAAKQKDCEYEAAMARANALGQTFATESAWTDWAASGLSSLQTAAEAQRQARDHLRTAQVAIESKDLDPAIASLGQALAVPNLPACMTQKIGELERELERRKRFGDLTSQVADATNVACDYDLAAQLIGRVAAIQPRDPWIGEWLDENIPKLADMQKRERQAMQLIADAKAAAAAKPSDTKRAKALLLQARDVAPDCVRRRERIDQLIADLERGPETSIVLLIDTSGSMGDNGKIGHAKRAAEAAVRKASQSTEMAILTFDGGCSTSSVSVVHDFSTDANSLMASLGSLTPGGGTPMYIAVQVAVEYAAKRPTKSRQVVLMSDGGDSCRDKIASASNGIRTQNIPVSTIGFDVGNNKQAQGDLANLSGMTNGRSYSASATDPRDIIRAFDMALLPSLLKGVDLQGGGQVQQVADYFRLASSAVQRQDLEGALFQYKQAHRMAPESSAVNYNLSLLYEAEDQLTAAMKHAGEYLKLAPNALDRGDVENRIQNLEAELEKNPRVQYEDRGGCRDVFAWARIEEKKARDAKRRQAVLKIKIEAQRGNCDEARSLQSSYQQSWQ